MKYEDFDYSNFTEDNYSKEKSDEDYVLLPQMRSSGVRFFIDKDAPVVLINLHSLNGKRIADDKELITSIVRKSIAAQNYHSNEVLKWEENFIKNPKKYIGYFSNKSLNSVFYDRYAAWLDRTSKKDNNTCWSKIVGFIAKLNRNREKQNG